MEKPAKIKCADIKSISTKFYYKGKKLCFQIIMSYGDDDRLFYRDFEDYNEYKEKHNSLISALNSEKKVISNFFKIPVRRRALSNQLS